MILPMGKTASIARNRAPFKSGNRSGRLITLPPRDVPLFEPIVIVFEPTPHASASMNGGLLWLALPALFASMVALAAIFMQASPPQNLFIPAPSVAAPALPSFTTPINQGSVTIAPLPERAFTGLSFYHDAPASPPPAPVDIVPLIASLPVGNLPKPAEKPEVVAFSIDIDQEYVPSVTDKAAQAAMAGDNEKAIRLYTRALKQDPSDKQARHNLTALLLDEAAKLDEAHKTTKAIAAYKKVLSTGSRSENLDDVRARLNYLTHRHP